jgi:hypothetical protein
MRVSFPSPRPGAVVAHPHSAMRRSSERSASLGGRVYSDENRPGDCKHPGLASLVETGPARYTGRRPATSLRKALSEVYAYYRRNEQMLANFTRDAQANSNVRKVLEPRVKNQERMRDVLAAGWEQGDGQRHRLLYGVLWMSLDFQTWHTLVRQQAFDDQEVIELMVGMVRCLLGPQ